MAGPLKSTGEIPIHKTFADANEAISMLNELHHWACTRCNSNGRRSYSVTITHAGRRVSGNSGSFITAANVAMAKLCNKPTKACHMRIAN